MKLTLLGDHNPKLRTLRRLHSVNGRREEGAFIIEGTKSVSAALADGFPLSALFIGQDTPEDAELARAVRAARRKRVPLYGISPRALKGASDVRTPQGVLAVGVLPPAPGELAGFCRGKRFLVVVDGVQDPGNLGALVRTSRAAGADGMLLSEGCADPFSPRAVRGSMGGVFGLPLFPRLAAGEIAAWLAADGRAAYGGLPRGGRAPWEVEFKAPLALLVGSEGAGLNGQLAGLCRPLTIPMAGHVESLNVAVAFGVIAVEVARQLSEGRGRR